MRAALFQPPSTMIVGIFALIAALTLTSGSLAAEETDTFAKDQLIAWCIVPFDAQQRSPAERVEMLKRLGLRRVAYDWRAEHVASFEEEILQYKKNGIDFFAFWDQQDEAFALFEKYDLHPQIWKIMPSPTEGTQAEKVEAAARGLLPLVEKTQAMGCQLGIYNHGGWNGQPENMVAVVEWLRDHADAKHVGIVYNFHHGHEHMDRFAEAFELMKPYLLCVNLNGMNDNGQPKILPIGDGKHEIGMMKTVRASGYDGPIGILDHRSELDAEESLSQNLRGLEAVLPQLK